MKTRERATQELAQDPTMAFDRPRDVLGAPGLSVAEKRRILEAWKVDAQNLQTATEENMQGGEASRLGEVLAALDELDMLAKQAEAAPRRRR